MDTISIFFIAFLAIILFLIMPISAWLLVKYGANKNHNKHFLGSLLAALIVLAVSYIVNQISEMPFETGNSAATYAGLSFALWIWISLFKWAKHKQNG